MTNTAVAEEGIRPLGSHLSRRQLWNWCARLSLYVSAALTSLLLVFMIGYIFYRGVPYLTWELLSTQSSYLNKSIGIFPNLVNTVYIIFVAMSIVPR